jgi:hypothetical protein
MEITKDGKEELALAIFLWKEFKSQGKLDLVILTQALKLASHIGVADEYNDLVKKFIWPIEIKIKL